MTENTGPTARDLAEAYSANGHRRLALTQREWADTGEHGWTHEPRLSSVPGWWVLPGMVLPERFSNEIAVLGLGDVRVVGRAQKAADYKYAPWAILVESIATGERAVYTTRTYDRHECHVYAPSYLLSREAFHAFYAGALSTSTLAPVAAAAR